MTYQPAVGDTVRLVGDPHRREWKVLAGDTPESWSIVRPGRSHIVESWQVEKVEPPTPPEPPVGSVVLDGDGDIWQRLGDSWSSCDCDEAEWQTLQKYAPLTPLVNPSDDDAVRAAGLCRVEDVEA